MSIRGSLSVRFLNENLPLFFLSAYIREIRGQSSSGVFGQWVVDSVVVVLPCGRYNPSSITFTEAALKMQPWHPDALVIGADQVLVFCGRIVNKSPDLAEARSLLASLSGKSHELISAAALAKDGSVVWRTASTVEMQMRTVSDAFIDNYLAACGEGILSSVGAYKFEAEGVQLFSGYSGDYFAILGLPLLPLLSALREFGVLPA